MATNGDSVFLQNTLSRLSLQAGSEGVDYWTEAFDTSKNCKQEKKITKLMNEVGAHELKKIILCSSLVIRNYLTI